MNLSNLQTFLEIVETGSLIRASENLNVTQSTITARLKTLEQELGQTLFLRRKSWYSDDGAWREVFAIRRGDGRVVAAGKTGSIFAGGRRGVGEHWVSF